MDTTYVLRGVDVLLEISSVYFANLHETGGKKKHAVKSLKTGVSKTKTHENEDLRPKTKI